MISFHRTLLGICALFIASLAYSQTTISGNVLDAANSISLPGVNIILSEPFKATVTDIDGNYSLEVPDEAMADGVLTFSFIGYRDEIVPIEGRTQIDVRMEAKAEILDEVVVTAIGISREKKALGYSATEVSSEDVKKSGELNLMNALNAKVAGVSVTSSSGNPGASTTVRIRGNKSIGGNNDPLYVIDGVPVDNTYRGSNFTDQSNRLVDINPEDIESMTVLKGGAASALYGYRAANGAVIITTKRGKEGKTKVDFQSTTNFDMVNRLPEKQTIFGQGTGGNAAENVQFSWGEEIDGETYDAEDFFKTGITTDNYIAISGGGADSDFLLSIGHLRQNGIIPDSYFNRTSLKLSGGRTFKEKLRVGASIQMSVSDANRTQRGSNLSGVMLGLMRAPVDYNLANGSDDPVSDESAWQNPDGSQRTYFENYDNPYWSVNKNRNDEDNFRSIASLNLSYDLSPKVKLKNILSADINSNQRKSYWDKRSNEFKGDNGRILNLSSDQTNINNDFVLTYTDDISEDLDVTVLLGHNYFDYSTTTYEIEGFGFIIEDFYDFSNTNIINGFADDFLRRERGIGVYANVDLGYKDKLFLGLTGRNDWLSNLPNAKDGFFYPAVNLGYLFFENAENESKWLDFAKVRLSWANTGNGAPSPYITQDVFVGGGSVHGLATFRPSTLLGNAGLEPENSVTYEAGLDLRFLKNRFSLDVTYYKAITRDPIVTVQIPASAGYFSSVVNGDGEIINEGIEALLTAAVISPKNKGSLYWDASVNFTLNRNRVESILPGIDVVPLPSFGLASTQSVAAVGEAFGVLLGSQWLRDEDDNIIVNENGYPIRDSERGIIGDPNPHWTAGVRNDIGYRNWNLSFLLDVRVGGDMFNGTRNVMRFHGTHIDTEDREETIIWDGVTESGEPNTIPISLDQSFYSLYGLTYVSEEGIEEVNWLRMRDLSITYQFSDELIRKIGASRLSLTLITRNLFLITNYTGIDPETSLSGAANSFGRDYFNSPNTKSYGIRLSATF